MIALDTSRFQLIADALHGSGGFADGSHIIKYPRESDAKFAARKAVAWYASDLKPACSRFVGYLAKKPPTRELGANALIKGFADDCDWRGNSLDVFLQGFAVEAKARGCMALLVDMPSEAPANAAEQLERRFFPYLVPIAPEEIAGLELDERGRILKISISATGFDDLGRPIQVLRYWDDVKWSVSHGGQVIDEGEHNLGVCPVLAFSESGDFPAFGDFSAIADISKRLYNLRSELDEILRAQTFSILAYHVPEELRTSLDTGPIAEGIGTHNMLLYHGNAPAFISPSEGPARVYMDQIAALERQVRDIALTIESADQMKAAESGVALTIRFQALNSALATFANRVEDFERRIWDVVGRWLRFDPNVSVEYPRDFAIADLAMEIQVLQNYQAAGMPDEVLREKKKQVVGLDFAGCDPNALDAMLSAIDEAEAELPTGADPFGLSPENDPAPGGRE